ncbi:MAG: GNAT family N-acetyltransferase [Alphaproteobacteria bacterium]|nr:GNAT family N-acetyltransferase [Alphaproteobacteria bacterium]
MIRLAEPGDLPALMRLLRDFAAYEELSHELVADETALGAALFGAVPRLHALVATAAEDRDASLIGFAFWFYTFRSFSCRPNLFIEDIYVDPSCRGRGVGLAMFRALARIAGEQGCRKLEWMVLEDNAPARAFYARLGAANPLRWIPQELSGEALVALASQPTS